jgi:hypothetical protein
VLSALAGGAESALTSLATSDAESFDADGLVERPQAKRRQTVGAAMTGEIRMWSDFAGFVPASDGMQNGEGR